MPLLSRVAAVAVPSFYPAHHCQRIFPCCRHAIATPWTRCCHRLHHFIKATVALLFCVVPTVVNSDASPWPSLCHCRRCCRHNDIVIIVAAVTAIVVSLPLRRRSVVAVASLLWRHCCGVIAVASLLLHRRYRFCCRHCVGAIVSLSSLLRCCGRCVFPIADDICHFCCGRCCLLNPNRNRSNRSNRSNRQTQRMNLFADHHHHVKQQHPCLGSRTTNWSVQSIDRSIDRSRLIDRLID